MQTGTSNFIESDELDTPMSNVVALFRSAAAEPVSIGQEFAWILDELAVRMRGNFDYPRVVVSSKSAHPSTSQN